MAFDSNSTALRAMCLTLVNSSHLRIFAQCEAN